MIRRMLVQAALEIFAAAAAVASDKPAGLEPAIVRAAYWGDEAGLRAAVAAHADVNAVNAAGATALLYGVQSEAIERVLLEHGANPNLASKSGMTPLIAGAAQADSFVTVKMLLDHGANVHARIDEWEPALPAAIYGGDARTIRLLLDRGAKAGSSGKLTFSPLHAAAFMGDLATTKLLLARGADPDENPEFAGNALNWAMYAGADDCAAELVRRGANVKLASLAGAGTPPVIFAAYHQTDPALVKMLVAHGAAAAAANESGDDALTYAIRTQPDSALTAYLRSMGLSEKTVHSPQPQPMTAPASSPVDLSDASLRPRLRRAIAALEVSSDAFLARGFVQHDAKCISCHQQSLPAVAASLLAQRGLEVDLAPIGRAFAAQNAQWTGILAQVRELRFDASPDPSLVLGYPGMAEAAWHQEPNAVDQAMARYLISQQRTDGSWAEHDLRPPIEDGPIVGTGFAAHFISLYAAPEQKAAAGVAIAKARQFLEQAKPDTLNRKIFQLLGLSFTNGPLAQRRALAEAIIAQQRPDGGWEQMPSRGSDAWATGSALVTLVQTVGLPTNGPVYQKGAAFLVRTQGSDGVWWVRSRTWPFQPHFDGKFPHGKDQWISAAGTSWAVMALGLLLDRPAQQPQLPSMRQLLALAAKPAAAEGTPIAGSPAIGTPEAATADAAMFRQHIAPVLERSCFGCHGAEKHRGGLSLASREALLKGGQSGDPAVVVGDSSKSQLIDFVSDKVEDLEMPPLGKRAKYPPLTAEEIAHLKAWIDAGMPWDSAAAGAAAATDEKKL